MTAGRGEVTGGHGTDLVSVAPVWRRKVTAHGVLRNARGEVLLVPVAGGAGPWSLPGGTVGHGVSPQRAATRAAAAQTGLPVRVRAVRAATADRTTAPDGVHRHVDRLVFDLLVPPVPGGAPPPGHGARWFTEAELPDAGLPAFAAAVLGAAPSPQPSPQPSPRQAPQPASAPQPAPRPAGPPDPDDFWPVVRGMAMDGAGRHTRVQRFSTYARATDPAGRVLLARIAEGYPSAGRWHLPGGGTDAGEEPSAALLREVVEETGQSGRVGRLLSVSHRHNPVARGWEGYPINWHTIRVVYEMTVGQPSEPRVTETAGSTVEAAWMRPAEIDRAVLTDLAAAVL